MNISSPVHAQHAPLFAKARAHWHTLSLRTRRATTTVLAVALAFGGMFLAVTPAYAATETTSYIDANGNQSSVTAEIITGSTATTLQGGTSYVCKTTLTRGYFTNTGSGTVNLILADGCNLTITSTGNYESPIFHQGGTFNVYSQTNNTGKMTLTGAPYGAAISVRNGTFRIYGGTTYAYGGKGSAGIGGDEGKGTDGTTTRILGRASVYAVGGDGYSGNAGGAGIGGGGSSNDNRLGGGTFEVNTTGMVQAFGGAAYGGYYAGANIGGGGATLPPSTYINTYTVAAPTISPSAAASVVGTRPDGSTLAPARNVALGSRVTWKTTVNDGYQFNNASSPLSNPSTDVFTQTTLTSSGTINYWRTTTMALVASPTGQQTRPGNVVLTANIKAGSTNLNLRPISFYDGSSLLGTVNSDSSGNASYTVTSPTAGTKTYQAKFDADSTYGPSSKSLTYSVVNPTPVITLTASPVNQQTRPGNVTITANMKAAGTNINAISLQLYINGVLQAGTAQTNSSGNAVFTHTAPPAGTYSYQVKWTGNSSYPAADSNVLSGYQVIRDTQNALTLAGLATSYTYGDAPLTLTTGGGSGTGEVTLTSSNPTVASLTGTTTTGSGTLTLNRAGTFTITQQKAEDTTYAEMVRVSPTTTVLEATPVVSLTRTGGDTLTTPVNATLQVFARGTGTTPTGFVQFYQRNIALGDPLPLIDNGDGSASVSLTNIPLTHMGSQIVTAEFLGETGKYKTVTKSDEWYIGNMGYCKVETPEA